MYTDNYFNRFELAPEVAEALKKCKCIAYAETKEELQEMAYGPTHTSRYDVVYPIEGLGTVKEAEVVRCKNGCVVNFMEDYMRRRDPNSMAIGDELPTDKPRFRDRFGYEFSKLRQETLDWLSNQQIVMLPFYAGPNGHGYPSLMICPLNAAFFALSLANMQGFTSIVDVPEHYKPRAIIFVAPPFRHTHFDGKQVVVHNRLDFEFYGGKTKSTEKRTKVKSRVMANALGELISDASQVFIMGHKHADFDAVGAAAGVCCIARKRGKKAQIVIDMDDNAAGPILKRLAALPEYKDAFISGSDAFIKAQPGALLVVVDTNRPDFVESEQLLDTCNRVAVIDHHRRAASYIESAALNFHEPYASSASELVTELLQYLIEPTDLLREEAGALLAGIVLDTKHFTQRTGGRTFEAAAWLRAGCSRVLAMQPFGCLPNHVCGRGQYAALVRRVGAGKLVSVDVDASLPRLGVYHRVKLLLEPWEECNPRPTP